MKRMLVAAAAAALACSSSHSVDPSQVKFQYGAAQTPTTQELAAANVGASSSGDAVTLKATSDATTATTTGGSVMTMPDAMADQCMGTGSTVIAMSAQALSGDATLAGTAQAATALTGFDDPSCVTVSTGRIDYHACTITTTSGVVHVDGYVSRDAGTVTWDLTSGAGFSGTGSTMDVTVHATGDLVIDASTITGNARNDTTVKMTSSMMSATIAYSTLADVALQYQADPFCVTGGTLELKRVWTQRMPGMSTDPAYADRGLLFTWSGCGVVQVQRSL